MTSDDNTLLLVNEALEKLAADPRVSCRSFTLFKPVFYTYILQSVPRPDLL